MTRSAQRFLRSATALAPLPVLVYAFSGGPPARSTGAPGDQTCARAGCHAGTLNPDANGRLTLTFPSGLVYTPGVRQRLRVTLAHPEARRWGFQLTARLASDERSGQAGTFTPTDNSTFVNCENDTPRAGASCPAAAPVEFIEHAPGSTRQGTAVSSSWEVDWTPPANASGDVVFYLAGNAANNDAFPTGDRIYTAKVTVTGPAPVVRPSISAVVNGASFRPGVAPNAWVTIQGANLAGTTRALRSDEIVEGRLPVQLDDVRVSVNEKLAVVAFISPAQLNVLAPTDSALGPVAVQVIRATGVSDPMMTQVRKQAPAFFLFAGGRYAAATHADGSLAGPRTLFPGASTPARPGEVLILYGTGFGSTTPTIPSGQLTDRLTALNDPVTIRVGGVSAEIQFAGLAPGFAGLYQFNVKVPDSTADGDATLTAEIGGEMSPDAVFLAIQR